MEENSAKRVRLPVKIAVLLGILSVIIYAVPDPPGATKIWADPDVTPEQLANAPRPIGTDWLLVYNTRYLKSIPGFTKTIQALGIWQSWDMFSPNPSSWDGYVTADVTYRSGKVVRDLYPRMKTLSLSAKYIKERYRKFLERAHNEQNSWIWPYFAQRIAYEADNEPGNPPVRVQLHRRWRIIQPPDKPQQREYYDYVYFNYAVDPQRLRVRPRSEVPHE